MDIRRKLIMRLKQCCVLAVLCVPLSWLMAEEIALATEPEIDFSRWRCKYCLFEEGMHGTLELGIGQLSDDSFKFGQYTGLNQANNFFVANADLRYRHQNASYMDLTASDLGLDSRTLSIDAGKQRQYQLFINYSELPYFTSDSAKTPYRGIGSDHLSLPSTWNAAGVTHDMSELNVSAQEVGLDTQRNQLTLGALFNANTHWEYAAKYHRTTKQGKKRLAGSFFFKAVQLVAPVDYVTDEVDASASYYQTKWQLKLAYYASAFRNRNKSLIWQNPFTSIVAGADSGQLALPPDNQFQQIIFSTGYQISAQTRVNGDVAVGRMEQNETFLPATLNSNLVVAPLPASTAAIRVNTVTGKFRISSSLTDKLKLQANYIYHERDNKTPQRVYPWVTTDSFVALPRTNSPYSFTRSVVKLRADYRVLKRSSMAMGFDYQRQKRTLQAINKTKDHHFWGKLNVRIRQAVAITAKLEHAQRNASAYDGITLDDAPQNPLLKKYNMADRIRDKLAIHASLTPHEQINIGLGIDFANDDYHKSKLGLTESQNVTVSLDSSVRLGQKTSVYFYKSYEQIESKQIGSQIFARPDWYANNNDRVDSFVMGVKYQAVRNKLDFGLDYNQMRTRGEVTVHNGAGNTGFPDLFTKLDALKIYTDYRWKTSMSLHLAYWYERYHSDDWSRQGVTLDTSPNLLSLGEVSPSHRIHVITLSMRYRF